MAEESADEGRDVAAPAVADPSEACATEPDTPSAAGEKRFRWRSRHYSPEELDQARQMWRDAMPWDHPMSRGDKFLIFSILGIALVMLLSWPARPFLLASHPVALSAVTGSLSAIGAGAAFARTGDGELWLVIVAGVFGMIKFDWLFWLAGRRWGPKIIELWAPGDVARRFVSRIQGWPSWTMPVVVMAATLPGVPASAVFAVAGLGGMRLPVFLIFDALGAAMMVGLVAGLGYGAGQHAVDVVLTIDRYALWITLGLLAVVAVRVGYRGHRQERANAGTRPDQ